MDRLRSVVESARRLALSDEVPHSAPYLSLKGKHNDTVKEERLLVELHDCAKEPLGHFERLEARLALYFTGAYCGALYLKVEKVRERPLC